MGKELKRPLPRVLLLVATVLLAFGTALAWSFWQSCLQRAMSYDLREVAFLPQRSMVYDGTGKVIAWMHGENRLLVPLRDMPEDFINAIVAREDARFYEHHGVDFQGILRAAWANLREGQIRQGGSTITQQLARNTFDLSERTFERKLVEAFLALRIEREYSKKRILEYYLNRIYFGEGCYGVQRAAQVYFGKRAGALSLSESATLAGLIRSPHRISPLRDLGAALEQRNLVLDRMQALGMIPHEAAAQAYREALSLSGDRGYPRSPGYIIDAVQRDLNVYLTPRQLRKGGLRIMTTIDPVLQEAAEKAVAKRTRALEKNRSWKHPRKAAHTTTDDEKQRTDYLQAALIAIENRTGAIRALVGGRDYDQSHYDRACLARRQVGSTFKPFVYATAFANGLLPGDAVSDGPIEPGEFGPHFPKKWSPANADGNYGGLAPAASGLIRSRNTMSIRVGEHAGLQAVLHMAQTLGLQGVLPYPAIYLGGFESTLRELTSAYTVFPNSGQWRPSYLISRIEDATGRVLYSASAREGKQVLDVAAAEMTSDLMESVLKVGTASRSSRLGLKKLAAGKTGTSNDCKDAWFVGYTSSLTCGVWVGFDQPKTIMAGGYGSVLALPIWVDFIQKAPEKRYPAEVFCRKSPRAPVVICQDTRQQAHVGCQHAGRGQTVSLPVGMAPRHSCQAHSPYLEPEWPEAVAAYDEYGDSDMQQPLRRAPVAEPIPRSMRPRQPRQSRQSGQSGNPHGVRLQPGETLYYTRDGPVIIRERTRYRRGPSHYDEW